MTTTKSQAFLGGFFAALGIQMLAGTQTGRALTTRLDQAYDTTAPRIFRAIRIFWTIEGILLLALLAMIGAEEWTKSAWVMCLMSTPFLALMFFLKSMFPKLKGAIRGLAIPILMFFDAVIMFLIIFHIDWTGSTKLLMYFTIIKLFADLGMITGIDTNRPYILLVWGIVLALVVAGGLNYTGFGKRVEKWHQQMLFDNLKKAVSYRITTRPVTVYQLADDELQKIKSGRKVNIKYVRDYRPVMTLADSTVIKVCGWASVSESITGIPNFVGILADSSGSFNPAPMADLDSLRHRYVLIPLEPTAEYEMPIMVVVSGDAPIVTDPDLQPERGTMIYWSKSPDLRDQLFHLTYMGGNVTIAFPKGQTGSWEKMGVAGGRSFIVQAADSVGKPHSVPITMRVEKLASGDLKIDIKKM